MTQTIMSSVTLAATEISVSRHDFSSFEIGTATYPHVLPAYVENNTPNMSLDAAVTSAQNAVGGTWDGADPDYAYVVKDSGRLSFAYVLHVTSNSSSTPYMVYINGFSGDIDEVVNQQTRAVAVSQ